MQVRSKEECSWNREPHTDKAIYSNTHSDYRASGDWGGYAALSFGSDEGLIHSRDSQTARGFLGGAVFSGGRAHGGLRYCSFLGTAQLGSGTGSLALGQKCCSHYQGKQAHLGHQRQTSPSTCAT